MDILLLYLLTGAFAGTVAGLLGVGGGLIIVPILVFVFHRIGVADAVAVHLAIGTSLATMIVTSISSMRAHHRRGAVDWPVFRRLTPGIVAGALLGAAIADLLPSPVLRVVFAVFELLVAAQIGFNLHTSPQRQLPGNPVMTFTGVVIGAVSAVIGIGGGTMTVPFLVWGNVALRRAVATSSACGLPIAVAGAAGFVIAGWSETSLPEYASGYLYWPAFAAIALASLFFAPLGAKLAHTLPATMLRRFFAVFLAVLGVRMFLSA
jgi:uncharacterized membrane protein YfcA